MHAYVHACINSYTHTYTYTHTLHTYLHTNIHACMYAYIHTYLPTNLPTYLPTYIHTSIHTYIWIYVYTVYMFTHIHTYIYIYIYIMQHHLGSTGRLRGSRAARLDPSWPRSAPPGGPRSSRDLRAHEKPKGRQGGGRPRSLAGPPPPGGCRVALPRRPGAAAGLLGTSRADILRRGVVAAGIAGVLSPVMNCRPLIFSSMALWPPRLPGTCLP